jgi:hypothetical protein
MGEFELIARFFTRAPRRTDAVALGVGDDCALLAPAPGMQLAVSTDMLVEGRHFLPTVPPARLGHKALAVNLSDLAACGAEPLAFTLALALPRADETFLGELAAGMFALADMHRIDLVGGDTTAGPLNLCVTVFGQVPAGQALRRNGAKPGDELWVSGRLGDARLALETFRGRVALGAGEFDRVREAMERPQPRVALGIALRGIATSWRSGSRCAASRRARSTSATGWSATSAMCSPPRAWRRTSTSRPCRAARCSRASRRPCSTSVCWPAATTTNSCSPLPRPMPTRCAPPPAGPASRSRASAGSRPGAACPCTGRAASR